VPGIEPVEIEVLGDSELPPPVPVTFAQLAAGEMNYQRVEVRGIVRATVPAPIARCSGCKAAPAGWRSTSRGRTRKPPRGW